MFDTYQNMKIMSKQNRTNFTSLPLYKVEKIPKVENERVCGYLKGLMLQLNPAEDEEIIKPVQNNWKGEYEPLYWLFIDNFRNTAKEDNYYAIEITSEGNLFKKTAGLIQQKFKNHNGNLELSLLLVNPEFIAEKWNRKVKDLGQILLTAPFKKAQEIKSPAIEFEFMDTNEGFYNKAFNAAEIYAKKYIDTKNKTKNFLVENKEYNKYLKYCQEIFGIDFSEQFKEGILV